VLSLIEAMKVESAISAPLRGRVERIAAAECTLTAAAG
jgi:biotin carboxyl carrier protein